MFETIRWGGLDTKHQNSSSSILSPAMKTNAEFIKWGFGNSTNNVFLR